MDDEENAQHKDKQRDWLTAQRQGDHCAADKDGEKTAATILRFPDGEHLELAEAKTSEPPHEPKKNNVTSLWGNDELPRPTPWDVGCLAEAFLNKFQQRGGRLIDSYTNFQGTKYYWRAQERIIQGGTYYQGQWGSCKEHEAKVQSWRDVGTVCLDESAAMSKARVMAKHLADKS